MRYALLIYPGGELERLAEAEEASVVAEYLAIAQAPCVLAANRLYPPASATTVRVQDGKTLTTDGPFADTKEILGGFCLLEVDNLDVAIELAARVPAARMGGAVELRPVVEG